MERERKPAAENSRLRRRTVALARKRAKARAAVKAIERDDRLRRPQNPYFLWLNDNRERIIGMLGKGGPEVTKKGSQMWKELSEQERKLYEEKALKAKDARLAYLQTPEGVEALKAFETAKARVDDAMRMEAATDEDETEVTKSRRHRTCGRTVALTRKSACLLYTSPSPRDRTRSRMPSSA